MKSKAGIVCLILGALLILSALFLYIYNTTEDEKAGEYSARILEKVADIIEENKNEGSYYINSDTQMQIAEVDGDGYIGYIYIPVLEELNLPVMAQWSYENLKKAPCRYSGSVKEGNMVLLGHNYTAHFGKLSRLTPGDKVYFTDINGNLYTYEVVCIDILGQSDVKEMIAGEYELSLFTCDYSGNNRMTIRCAKN